MESETIFINLVNKYNLHTVINEMVKSDMSLNNFENFIIKIRDKINLKIISKIKFNIDDSNQKQKFINQIIMIMINKNINYHDLKSFKICLLSGLQHSNKYIVKRMYDIMKKNNNEYSFCNHRSIDDDNSIIIKLLKHDNIYGLKIIDEIEPITPYFFDKLFAKYINMTLDQNQYLPFDDDQTILSIQNMLDYLLTYDKRNNLSDIIMVRKINNAFRRICSLNFAKECAFTKLYYEKYKHIINIFSPELFIFKNTSSNVIVFLIDEIIKIAEINQNVYNDIIKLIMTLSYYYEITRDIYYYKNVMAILNKITEKLSDKFTFTISDTSQVYNSMQSNLSNCTTFRKEDHLTYDIDFIKVMYILSPHIKDMLVYMLCSHVNKIIGNKDYYISKTDKIIFEWIMSNNEMAEIIFNKFIEKMSGNKHLMPCQLCLKETKHVFKKCYHNICNDCFKNYFSNILKNKICLVCSTCNIKSKSNIAAINYLSDDSDESDNSDESNESDLSDGSDDSDDSDDNE